MLRCITNEKYYLDDGWFHIVLCPEPLLKNNFVLQMTSLFVFLISTLVGNRTENSVQLTFTDKWVLIIDGC